MPYKILISAVAFNETDNAFTYYETQLPGLGDRFLQSLEEAYGKIAQTPQHYGFINSNKDLKDLRIKDFPFVIIFQIVIDSVFVLRVFNTNRDPRLLKNL